MRLAEKRVVLKIRGHATGETEIGGMNRRELLARTETPMNVTREKGTG